VTTKNINFLLSEATLLWSATTDSRGYKEKWSQTSQRCMVRWQEPKDSRWKTGYSDLMYRKHFSPYC